jgi:hypothetical protein
MGVCVGWCVADRPDQIPSLPLHAGRRRSDKGAVHLAHDVGRTNHEVNWSTGFLRGVRITSPSLTRTLTVREETRPLLFALGEALTRLNLLDEVQGGVHEVDVRQALGLDQDMARRSVVDTEGPSIATPQDRPSDGPTAVRNEPGLQDEPRIEP